MNEIEKAFKKIFGDMYLSESETALRIFEYGYQAGMDHALQMIKDQMLDEAVKGGLND